jgi:6-pyruvoyltetrahydropterin/6-carboxytetrahydropterin synthase
MKITRKYHFHAAHRVLGAGYKCERIHGHTYKFEADFSFKGFDDIAMLFEDIDKAVTPIVSEIDHCFVLDTDDSIAMLLERNLVHFLSFPGQPTCENIARYLFVRISKKMPSLRRIRLSETESGYITVKKRDCKQYQKLKNV